MKKKWIGLMLAIWAAIYITGCSYNNNWDISEFVSDDSQALDVEDKWQIGVLAAKTGDCAEAGLSMVDGLKLAVDEINKSGGIAGRQVTYLVLDDEANAKRAQNTYNTLKDWGMDVLIGTTSEDTTINIAKLTDEDKIFMLTPAVLEADALVEHPSLFSVYLSECELGTEAADYVGASELGKNVAIFYERFDVDMRELCTSFTQQIEKYDIEVVATEKFMQSHSLDFEEMLMECKEAEAEILFLPLDRQVCKMILDKAAEIEYDPIFVGLDGLGELMESDEGADISAGRVIALSEGDPEETSGNVIRFSRRFTYEYDRVPDESARAGYDSVYILKSAIEKANLDGDIEDEEMFDALSLAMQKITYTGLIGEDTTWNSDGLASKELFARTYINAVN